MDTKSISKKTKNSIKRAIYTFWYNEWKEQNTMHVVSDAEREELEHLESKTCATFKTEDVCPDPQCMWQKNILTFNIRGRCELNKDWVGKNIVTPIRLTKEAPGDVPVASLALRCAWSDALRERVAELSEVYGKGHIGYHDMMFVSYVLATTMSMDARDVHFRAVRALDEIADKTVPFASKVLIADGIIGWNRVERYNQLTGMAAIAGMIGILHAASPTVPAEPPVGSTYEYIAQGGEGMILREYRQPSLVGRMVGAEAQGSNFVMKRGKYYQPYDDYYGAVTVGAICDNDGKSKQPGTACTYPVSYFDIRLAGDDVPGILFRPLTLKMNYYPMGDLSNFLQRLEVRSSLRIIGDLAKQVFERVKMLEHRGVFSIDFKTRNMLVDVEKNGHVRVDITDFAHINYISNAKHIRLIQHATNAKVAVHVMGHDPAGSVKVFHRISVMNAFKFMVMHAFAYDHVYPDMEDYLYDEDKIVRTLVRDIDNMLDTMLELSHENVDVDTYDDFILTAIQRLEGLEELASRRVYEPRHSRVSKTLKLPIT